MSKMLKVIVDDKIPFLKGTLEPYAFIEYLPSSLIIRENIKHADALLIRTRTKCNSDLLEGTSVKFIATATIGYDHIDAEYCQKRNIKWVNAPGCNSSAVQQYMLSALLTLAENHQFQLSDKTIGIVGVGNVGTKVEMVARLLGMKVKLNDPPRSGKEGPQDFVTLEEILEASDLITLHVPLILDGENKTFHLFDNSVFEKMNQSAWLINTSRGEVVETDALKRALSSGKLVGAVLDVWENEPNIDIDLLRKVAIATPHIAGYSWEGKANATKIIVDALMLHFSLPVHEIVMPSLPVPSKNKIIIDADTGSVQTVIHEAVNQIFPISNDNKHLQNSPGSFEQQRSNYHFRREFSAYSLKIQHGDSTVGAILKNLGFLFI
jgi:erythronate-4-phosphate dehydrogenase